LVVLDDDFSFIVRLPDGTEDLDNIKKATVISLPFMSRLQDVLDSGVAHGRRLLPVHIVFLELLIRLARLSSRTRGQCDEPSPQLQSLFNKRRFPSLFRGEALMIILSVLELPFIVD
jgi:hypothetical protein